MAFVAMQSSDTGQNPTNIYAYVTNGPDRKPYRMCVVWEHGMGTDTNMESA